MVSHYCSHSLFDQFTRLERRGEGGLTREPSKIILDLSQSIHSNSRRLPLLTYIRIRPFSNRRSKSKHPSRFESKLPCKSSLVTKQRSATTLNRRRRIEALELRRIWRVIHRRRRRDHGVQRACNGVCGERVERRDRVVERRFLFDQRYLVTRNVFISRSFLSAKWWREYETNQI